MPQFNRLSSNNTLFYVCLALGLLLLSLFVVNLFGLIPSTYPYNIGSSEDEDRLVTEAITTSNPTICGNLRYATSVIFYESSIDQIRSYCYLRYITAHPEHNICPANEELCLDAYAELSDDPTPCFTLPSNRTFSCIVGVALHSNNKEVCALLSAPKDAMCLERFNR